MVSTKIGEHLRGNIVGYIAVFIALTGTAYASSALKKNTVGTKQIKTGAVTGPKIAPGAVDSSKLAPGAINLSNLPAGVVGTSNLADASVTTPKLADSAVNGSKLSDGAVGTQKIALGAVDSSRLAGSAVKTINLDVGAVDTPNILNGSLTAAKFAAPPPLEAITLDTTHFGPTPSVPTPTCYRDFLGVVHLAGFISSDGTQGVGSTFGSLPSDCVPTAIHAVPTLLLTIGTGAPRIADIVVDTSGNLSYNAASTWLSTEALGLEGITFRAPG